MMKRSVTGQGIVARAMLFDPERSNFSVSLTAADFKDTLLGVK